MQGLILRRLSIAGVGSPLWAAMEQHIYESQATLLRQHNAQSSYLRFTLDFQIIIRISEPDVLLLHAMLSGLAALAVPDGASKTLIVS